jgi:hypothetical protein
MGFRKFIVPPKSKLPEDVTAIFGRDIKSVIKIVSAM